MTPPAAASAAVERGTGSGPGPGPEPAPGPDVGLPSPLVEAPRANVRPTLDERWRPQAGARPRVEWPVVVPATALVALGLTFIHSATLEGVSGLFERQFLFVAVGVLCVLLVRHLGQRRLAAASFQFYGAVLAVLVLMPLFATDSGVGSERWISLPFGFKLQPSEFMKLALVLALARHLQHQGITNTWRSYAVPFALTVVPWFFVMRQPDLGSSLVLMPVFLAMVVVSGARMRHVALVVLAIGLLVPAAYWVPGVLEPYQKERIDAFLTPIPSMVAEARDKRDERDHEAARAIEARISDAKRGTGYQQFYSVVAIGSGGVEGTGLGRGIQNRSNRLPVRHSDFIFAVVGEEWGLLGTTLAVLLHAALATAILGVAYRTREPFGRLVCVGIGALVGSQALFNLGIATGMLPVTGLPLPLVSYGGSSVLSTMLALGCVLLVARERVDVFFDH